MKTHPEHFGGGRRHNAKPYTADGIKRLMCSRAGCGRAAHATWGACADDNVQRPLCPECDFELNAGVLRWFGHPEAQEKLAEYRRQLEEDAGRPLRFTYDRSWMLVGGQTVAFNGTGEPERVIPAP